MTYQLDHLTVSHHGTVVLDDLCLTLPRDRLIGVIGPNGAGKSTLVATLAGDLQIDQGRVLMDGKPVGATSINGLAQRRAVMAQQTAAVFNLAVSQVLELGLHAFAHWNARERTALMNEVAQLTQITPWLDQFITALSMGQQQRVHFARALLQAKAAFKEHGSAWLLLDEPTASQDPSQQQMMLSACREFAAQGAVGVLLVMHDLTLAAQWCDDIIVLKDRSILAHGPKHDVLTPDVLKRTYGAELDAQVVWQPVPGVIMSRR
jgi:iron complex transport system ATP-binding protein